MKLAIISGSHRSRSQSARVAAFVKTLVDENFPDIKSFGLDLSNKSIPFWTDDEEDRRTKLAWFSTAQQIQESDGIVLVSPEWNGMVTPALKNLFLLCSNQELAHKPALIVCVSGGQGGAYPVAELRMSSYKNTRICYIPEHIIIRNVDKMIGSDGYGPVPEQESYCRNRLRAALVLLVDYAIALKLVRQNKNWDFEQYPYGM